MESVETMVSRCIKECATSRGASRERFGIIVEIVEDVVD